MLGENSYGKSGIRLVKISRVEGRHEIQDITVAVRFEGEFGAVHTAGDNSAVLPTDTMKNTVYALAKDWDGEQIEELACRLIAHFLAANPQVSRVRIEIAQSQWVRMGAHAFEHGSEEKRTTGV